MTLENWPTGSLRLLIVALCFGLPQTLEQQSHSVEPETSSEGTTRLLSQQLIHPETGAEVVASVNSRPIYDVEIARYLDRIEGSEPLEPSVRRRYEMSILSQLVRRMVVLDYLQNSEYAATQQELDLAENEAKAKLESRGQTMEQFLADGRLDREMFRDGLAWNIAWTRYENKYLTEENLKRYFEKHRRDFDGTQRRVAQILLANADDPSYELNEAFHFGGTLLRSIQNGHLEFAEAAKEHSKAESAADGGDLGWIDRNGQLEPSLHDAIFVAKIDRPFGPLQSQFGVHLMIVYEERAGTKTWEEIRDEVREAAIRYLFGYTADRHSGQVRIRYGEAYPYLDADYYDPQLVKMVQIFRSAE